MWNDPAVSDTQQVLNIFLLAQGLMTRIKGIWDLLSNRINWDFPNRVGLHCRFTGSQDWTLHSGCLLNVTTPRFWVCISEAALKPISPSRYSDLVN